MPKISDEKRAARRAQILEAAWSCFQREGLHATTMDDIIRASGLSAGAVYSYYPSKDKLIMAAVTTSLSGLSALIEPILKAEPPPSPDDFVRQVTATIAGFTARDGYDLKRIALLGWSEAQRNERLRETMRGFYLAFRGRLADLVGSWRRSGLVGESVPEQDMAKALMSIILGFVVQAAILGDVDGAALASGLDGFARPTA
ncbi:TetR/AcrR family transcriptional regulator [Bosea sp. BK604]|uniref:TetR/AcrR family transcriptional regulator n=1 Tax=Bosea sp. BK604 TaxID=2512180 RepID=UPI0010518690|nr:TetR/AcrR family transcriptional regulator [Bosea sp. BK604]TCR67472.1 TetR family transcriptional regulator [Bosea sp. BK604]